MTEPTQNKSCETTEPQLTQADLGPLAERTQPTQSNLPWYCSAGFWYGVFIMFLGVSDYLMPIISDHCSPLMSRVLFVINGAVILVLRIFAYRPLRMDNPFPMPDTLRKWRS